MISHLYPRDEGRNVDRHQRTFLKVLVIVAVLLLAAVAGPVIYFAVEYLAGV